MHNAIHISTANAALNAAGKILGYGSTFIASLHNPYILGYMPVYVITSKHSMPLITTVLGEKLGMWVRTVFDPTNAMTITLLRPYIKNTFDTLDFISSEDEANNAIQWNKELFFERGMAVMTTAGACRDLTNWYNASSPQKPGLDGSSSAITKYTTIHLCRLAISDYIFSERNNMCAGAGEGAISFVNTLLTTPTYKLLLSNKVIPRIMFEWFAHKTADGVRWHVRDNMALNPIINLSEGALKVFIAEFAYSSTINFLRTFRSTTEEFIVKTGSETMDWIYNAADQTSNDLPHNNTEQTEAEDICLWGEIVHTINSDDLASSVNSDIMSA